MTSYMDYKKLYTYIDRKTKITVLQWRKPVILKLSMDEAGLLLDLLNLKLLENTKEDKGC